MMGTIFVLLSFPFLFIPAIGLNVTCIDYNTTAQPPHVHPLPSVTELPRNTITQISFIPEKECEKEGEIMMLFYYLALTILYNFGWATIQITQLAMVPEITSDGQDRMALVSIRNIATVISNLVTYAIFLLFVKSGN